VAARRGDTLERGEEGGAEDKVSEWVEKQRKRFFTGDIGG
jgi:hypothetical protein